VTHDKYRCHELAYLPDEASRIKRLMQILGERRRQANTLGYTPEKDDKLANGELAAAAACYATPSLDREHSTGVPYGWPFSRRRYKKAKLDRVEQLIQTGALILAELERIDRGVNLELLQQQTQRETTAHDGARVK